MKVYSIPIPPPKFSSERSEYVKAEAAYITAVRDYVRKRKPGNALVGEVVKFQVADGYAQYMVASGTELIHLELGDAYAIPEAHARGLRLADIKQMIARDKAFAALWRKGAA